MKSLLLLMAFTTFYLITAAQANQLGFALKAYLPVFVGASKDFSNFFHVSYPIPALAFQKESGNFHQIELSDPGFGSSEVSIDNGKVSTFTLGARYSYGIELYKSGTDKFKVFIAPGIHAVYDYSQFNPRVSSSYPNRINDLSGDLEVAPVLSYSFCRHLSAELSFPVSVIGFTQSYHHNLSPLMSEADQYQKSFSAYLGPQYFLGRAGLAFTW